MDTRPCLSRPVPCVLGPGADNLADYFTKYHPTIHHKNIRYYYVYSTDKSPIARKHPAILRGGADPETHCVDSSSGYRVPETPRATGTARRSQNQVTRGTWCAIAEQAQWPIQQVQPRPNFTPTKSGAPESHTASPIIRP